MSVALGSLPYLTQSTVPTAQFPAVESVGSARQSCVQCTVQSTPTVATGGTGSVPSLCAEQLYLYSSTLGL